VSWARMKGLVGGGGAVSGAMGDVAIDSLAETTDWGALLGAAGRLGRGGISLIITTLGR
jgi:hypothetical protein